jgi:hypothetical protein
MQTRLSLENSSDRKYQPVFIWKIPKTDMQAYFSRKPPTNRYAKQIFFRKCHRRICKPNIIWKIYRREYASLFLSGKIPKTDMNPDFSGNFHHGQMQKEIWKIPEAWNVLRM